jgi:hypothetical protein
VIRRTRWAASGGVLVGSFAILGGCGWVAGLQDLPEPAVWADDADAASSADGTAEALPDGNSQSEAATTDASDEVAASGCTCTVVPAGWAGPLALYQGSSAIPVPSCAGAYGATAFQGNADLVTPVASCTACTCGPQLGAKCGAHLTYYTNACGGTSTGCGAEDYGVLAGTCQGLGTGNGGCMGKDVQSFQADGVESQPGACTPSTATPDGTAASWQTSARACGLTSLDAGPVDAGSCDAGQVCAPAAAAPFDRVCIEAAGAQSCPGGTPFTTPYLYYTAFDDTRACGACSCSNPTLTCSPSGTVTFWTAFTCTGAATGTVTINNANGSGCETLPSMSYYSTYQPTSLVLGSCSPSGGAPTGSVAPSAATAVTFCCTK